jgi:hypothetical protein
MKVRRLFFILMLALIAPGYLWSQDLKEMLNQTEAEAKRPVDGLWKSTRIINGHSSKQMKQGELDYRISHRFGRLNSGAYEFFGLDQSTIHLSAEYGITDWLMVGIGRGSFEKTVDGFAKWNIKNQETGPGAFPVTISLVTSFEINTLRWQNPERDNLFLSRFTYAWQLITARKFGKFTLQLTPTLVHRNLVPAISDYNDLFALGIGGRYKLTNRLALTGEYYWVNHPETVLTSSSRYNPFSVGIDIETGGHVFQIMVTNSLGMREGTFIGNTTGSWAKGDVHLGFNISRVFTLKKNQKK